MIKRLPQKKGEVLTTLRYNANNTVDVYPTFYSNRWQKYNDYKDKFNLQTDLFTKARIKWDKFAETYENNYIPTPIQKIRQQELAKILRKRKRYFRKMTNISPVYDRKNKKSDGYILNKNAKNKIQGLITLLYHHSKQNKRPFNFYTFTVTEPKDFEYNRKKHDDVINQQFQKLLKNLRENYGLKICLYVAERQTGKRKMNVDAKPTGRLHYHCIFQFEGRTPHVQQINYYWLTLLEQIGFKTFNTEKMRNYVNNELNEIKCDYTKNYIRSKYKKAIKTNKITDCYYARGMQYNWNGVRNTKGIIITNPINKIIYNPVDVERITSMKKLSTYLTKYITKSDDKIFTRIWGASKPLLRTKVSVYFYHLDRLLEYIEQNTQKTKNGDKLKFTKQFKLSNDENAPTFFYIKYILNEKSKKNFKLKTAINSMVNQLNTNLIN